jgi:hypothetical protein
MEARKAYVNSGIRRPQVVCQLAPMVPFKDNHERPGPHVFVPDGNFTSLREQGKLRDTATLPGEAARGIMKTKKHHVPGYTGYVRGSQHIAGRTYGSMTRRAFDKDYNETLRVSPIPSAPNANRLVQQRKLEGTFVTTNMSSRTNKMPGYTGHVPLARKSYGLTYGETTINAQKEFSQTLSRPRRSAQERPGYAFTTYPRQFQTISSDPLPGTGSSYHKPPIKMIPKHLENLCDYYN